MERQSGYRQRFFVNIFSICASQRRKGLALGYKPHQLLNRKSNGQSFSSLL
ncbi:UNVERIFIED_CONTAM: hypothetical protein FKN15_041294 [Acipenser sinensis]